jgi:uncharacterized protein YjgD (DUF1641 family)
MAKISEVEKRNSGSEPEFEGTATHSQVASAYSWYNSYRDPIQLKKYFMEYAKKNYDKKTCSLLNKAKDNEFLSLGPLARMISRGLEIQQTSVEFIETRVKNLCEKYREIIEEKAEKPNNPMTVQDYIREKNQETIGEIENILDEGFVNEYKFTFKPMAFYKANETKAPALNAIIKYYSKLKDELDETIAGEDEQLNEAYKELKKLELKRYIDIITSIIRDAQERITQLSTTKKTRKKKEITPEQQVKTLTWKEEGSEISPTKIIGAKTLVVYVENIKRLCVFYADSIHGLGVKGSTIINFDKNKSVGFTLRKPEEILPTIPNIGTRAINNIIKDITTKKDVLTGRINKNTTLLAFIK